MSFHFRAYMSNTRGFEPTCQIQWADIVNPFYKTRWFYYLHLANPQWGFSRTKDIHDYTERIALQVTIL